MTNGTPLSAGDRLASLLREGNTSATHTPWWRSRRRVAVAGVVVVVASAALASRAFGSSGPAYQSAVVGRRSISAALTGTATIEPVSQAAVAFPISGTVAAVNVNVGDTVGVGQPLASLDPASLLDDLHSKQQALAQAQLALDNALSGQSGARLPAIDQTAPVPRELARQLAGRYQAGDKTLDLYQRDGHLWIFPPRSGLRIELRPNDLLSRPPDNRTPSGGFLP